VDSAFDAPPVSCLDQPASMHADDPGAPDSRLPVHVLVPVDDQPGRRPQDVRREPAEAPVRLAFPLMNAAGGIVGDEDVDRRERGEGKT
jgi:hypothetical protein